MRRTGQSEITGQLAALSKVFSPVVMDRLIDQRHSPYLDELLGNVELPDAVDSTTTVSAFLDTLYAQLVADYRCEYVYKNEIASKILLGRHSLNTAQLLTEVRVGQSKADVVVINGTSTAYEIKSEYDSMARLSGQLESYSRVFEYVNVVTAPSQMDQVMALAPQHVGVLVLTRRLTLSTVRAAGSNTVNMEHAALFDLLRKPEYLQVVAEHFGHIPAVPNGRVHAACRERFGTMPLVEAHRLTMGALSRRFSGRNLRELTGGISPSLRAYACAISSDAGRLRGLEELLSTPMHLIVN